jgi:hypothetical protein
MASGQRRRCGLSLERRHHSIGQLIRVEFARIGKLQNPDRDQLNNGRRSRQPHSGARLFECAVHRVDLFSTKGWRAATLIFALVLRFPVRCALGAW